MSLMVCGRTARIDNDVGWSDRNLDSIILLFFIFGHFFFHLEPRSLVLGSRVASDVTDMQ